MANEQSAALFNSVLRKLLDDLVTAFPEEQTLKRYSSNADTLFKLRPAYAQEKFEQTFGSKPQKIQARDDSIFDDFPSLFNIDFKGLWNKATSKNRQVIFDYLVQLNMTSKLGSAVPPSLLIAAENAAKTLTAKGLVPSGDKPLTTDVIQSVFSEVTKDPTCLSDLLQGLLQGAK